LPIYFLSAALAAAPTAIAGTQPDRADVTVVSVLTLAKELAGSDLFLRSTVAAYVGRTRSEDVFAAYLADVERDARHTMPLDPENKKLIDEARRAFFAREPERAKDLMRQCRWVQFDPCGGDLLAGRYGLPQEIVFQIRFLNWELETGDFDAAEKRLGTTEWSRWRASMIERVAGQFMAVGRRDEGMNILSLLRELGIKLESCLVENGPVATPRLFGNWLARGKGETPLTSHWP